MKKKKLFRKALYLFLAVSLLVSTLLFTGLPVVAEEEEEFFMCPFNCGYFGAMEVRCSGIHSYITPYNYSCSTSNGSPCYWFFDFYKTTVICHACEKGSYSLAGYDHPEYMPHTGYNCTQFGQNLICHFK